MKRTRHAAALATAGAILGLAPIAAGGAATRAAAGAPVHAAAVGATGSSGATGSTGAPAPGASVSANWAGYAVRGSSSPAHFTRVTGSWVAPAITCTAGSASYSAFWVGLGGYSTASRHLEQIGTEADCDSGGVPHYSAWYELVPHGSVAAHLAIAPGDEIRASVRVSAGTVTLTLTDRTTGARLRRRIPFAHADTTSAEWIAEAPSNCDASGCHPLPLGDFGTMTFTGASVATRSGVRGPISGADWSAVAIALDQRSHAADGVQVLGPRALLTAVPSVLSDAGGSFAVSWAEQAAPTVP